MTGASSGIGRELGRLFAEAGHPLIIVGQQEETLNAAADLFRAQGSPEVHTIIADLSLCGGPMKVRAYTEEHGLRVDVLVNDAGQGVHGAFITNDLEQELDIVQLNICSLLHLTKLYTIDMVGRGHGRVLQVASIASYQPTPLLAVYAATKAFVLSFTEALIDELKDTGVTMTAVIPGPTDTDFFRRAGMEHTKAAQDPQDPAVIARIAFEALWKGDRHAVAPGLGGQIVMSSLLSNDRVAAMAHDQMRPAEQPND
ncbi:MAG: SDR family NAD(P)-dependent oxidoreductase [Flavobacteriales bacterium]